MPRVYQVSRNVEATGIANRDQTEQDLGRQNTNQEKDIWCKIPAMYRIFIQRSLVYAVDEMSTRSRKIMFLSRARPVSRTDNLTAISEPIV
jgi:D-tyrosyl-tRNA(Tyr) deacylase